MAQTGCVELEGEEMKRAKIAYLFQRGERARRIAGFLKVYDERMMTEGEWQSLYDALCGFCDKMNVLYRRTAAATPYVVELTAMGNIAVVAGGQGKNRTVALVKYCEDEEVKMRRARTCCHKLASVMARDCVDAFYRVLKDRRCGIGQAMRIACDSVAPRFYFEFERARMHVSRIERGMPLEVKVRDKVEALHEIHRRWLALGTKSYTPLKDILEMPAPRFYISYAHFAKIVYEYLKKK